MGARGVTTCVELARPLLILGLGDSEKGGSVILHCNFEELQALMSASELIVAERHDLGGGVAAPAEGVEMVEQLLPRLTGDVSIETLDDQRRIESAVSYIVGELHRRLDEKIVESSPGNEDALHLYFDYGHSRTVLSRLSRMGTEMTAIIDLIGGSQAAAGITFPD